MINTQDSSTLTQRADEYIELRSNIKSIGIRIRELEEDSPYSQEIEELKIQLKEKKTQRNLEIQELEQLKEEKAGCTGKSKILMEMIAYEMKKKNPTLIKGAELPTIIYKGYKFIVRNKLVVQIAKGS